MSATLRLRYYLERYVQLSLPEERQMFFFIIIIILDNEIQLPNNIIEVKYCAVHYSAVQCRAMECITVQCSTLQCAWSVPISLTDRKGTRPQTPNNIQKQIKEKPITSQ